VWTEAVTNPAKPGVAAPYLWRLSEPTSMGFSAEVAQRRSRFRFSAWPPPKGVTSNVYTTISRTVSPSSDPDSKINARARDATSMPRQRESFHITRLRDGSVQISTAENLEVMIQDMSVDLDLMNNLEEAYASTHGTGLRVGGTGGPPDRLCVAHQRWGHG
jgi:hypothetical protein